MKKMIPALAGVLAIAFTQPFATKAQAPCDIKGIYTDPAQPAVNPEYPARTNTFNWYTGQENSGMAWKLNSQAINEPNIWMPWWQTDNAQITHIQGKVDLPKDGWELMKRDLGYNDAAQPITGTRNPYVILYNKRTGMLRVFTAIGDLFNSYQFAEIKLKFNTSGSSHKSATLNRMEGIGTALLDTPTGTGAEFVSIAPFLNYKSKWFMADFPMEYDPCACQFDSKLKIEVNLISQADVKEQSTTTGTLVTTNSSNPSATQTGSGFDQALAMGKKAYGAVSAGQKTYKSLDSWASGVKGKLGISTDKTAKSDAIDALKNVMKNNQFLKAGLNSIPYVGLAVSAFDAFFGGGKEESGPQPVALQPMTIEMNTVTTGTITANSLYSNPTFNNPGTRTINTALDYPYYNEAMGVFSLVEKPVVEYQSFTTTDGTFYGRTTTYHIPTNLKYAINPASGLEVQDFQVALMQGGSKLIDPAPGGWNYEGFAPVPGSTFKKYFLRTDYVDSGCLTNQVFTLETDSKTAYTPSTQPVYLKFILNLKPRVTTATTQNVLVVLKYPVTMRSVNEIIVDNTAPCLAVQPQMATADVQAVCSGSTYQTAVALRPTGPASAGVVAANTAAIIGEVQVYPNPAANATTIRFAGTAAGQASAYVTDMFGNQVLTIMQNAPVTEGLQEKAFDTSALPPGLYQCVITTPDGKRVSTRLSITR
ncbi:hypothetical protein GCM10022409_24660 [Hymenobacter glaciei]|uniref:Secretion system C-terminal sorting domain-containing protein n=1 Tax=Hymenobacter glaciei TaxID=877209 RepID=A0ABP7U9B5_9BACT